MSPGYAITTAIGNVFGGETDEVLAPRSLRKGRCGLVLVHGADNPLEFIDPIGQPSSLILAAAMASAGIPCVAGDMGGQAWGNDTVLGRIDAAWALLISQFGVRSDKLCLLGVSMGGAAVSLYSQRYPAKVACVVGLIPLLDLVAFYAANAGGTQGQVGTAWGVTAPAALPARADNATNAHLAENVPLLVGYSSVDATVLPAWVTPYVAKVGGTALVTDSTFGHSDQAVGGMPIATVGQFLAAHGA
jgi:hypothetical protein